LDIRQEEERRKKEGDILMLVDLALWALPGIVIIVIAVRTLLFKADIPDIPEDIAASPDVQTAVRHLGEAVQFRTISHDIPELTDWNEFTKFQKWIAETYPLVESRLHKTTVGNFTLIYHWEGSDSQLEPILLTAHQDVVPPGDEMSWKYPPFSGTVSEDGYLWGRGTLDIKIQMISLLETVEHLLQRHFSPRRSIYLTFGHDEEVGGKEGAAAAAAYFREQGIRFAFLLDEGGAVADNMISGLSLPFAAVGVAEKGYLDLEISCSQKGGHSSMPPTRTALGYVSRAVARLEKRQFPLSLAAVPREMFKRIGPFMPFYYRIILANLWLFKPLFLLILAGGGAGNAMVRTTTAPTMAAGSDAPNVMPSFASVVVNFRLMTGSSPEAAEKRVGKIIRQDREPLEVKRLLANAPSQVSPASCKEFTILSRTILQIFPGSVVSPYLMLGGTDAVKYQNLCSRIYRFCPYHVDSSELDRIHACDERISLDNISKSVRFFTQLIENLENSL